MKKTLLLLVPFIMLFTNYAYADYLLELIDGNSIQVFWYEIDRDKEIVNYRLKEFGMIKTVPATQVIDIKSEIDVNKRITSSQYGVLEETKIRGKNKSRKNRKRKGKSERCHSSWMGGKEIKKAAENSKLHYASGSGQIDIVMELIENGENVNKKTSYYGHTPLHLAAIGGHLDIAGYLIRKGANLNAVNRVSAWHLMICGTPLHFAVGACQSEMATLLLDKGANIEAINQYGETPLFATIWGNKNVAELLLDRGAAINATNNSGQTPLIKLVGGSPLREEMVSLFINGRANVNITDNNGKTALHIAVSNGYRAELEAIYRNHGISVSSTPVNKKDVFGEIKRRNLGGKPGHQDNPETLSNLLRSNPKYVHSRDKFGKTPLHWSSFYAQEKITKLLISYGADVNAIDNDGKTPLLCCSGNKEIMLMLISEGADINAKNPSGQTILHLIAEDIHKHEIYRDILKMLVSKRAKIYITDKSGRTPYDVAVQNGAQKWADILR